MAKDDRRLFHYLINHRAPRVRAIRRWNRLPDRIKVRHKRPIRLRRHLSRRDYRVSEDGSIQFRSAPFGHADEYPS